MAEQMPNSGMPHLPDLFSVLWLCCSSASGCSPVNADIFEVPLPAKEECSLKSKFVRLSHFKDRQVMRLGSGLILVWLSCKPALAYLPSVEAPESSGGTGLMGQIKAYAQDFIVFSGLLVCAVAFINVATSAVHTFVEVRNERATWTRFGSIVATGVVLLLATIWLLGQSAEIIL